MVCRQKHPRPDFQRNNWISLDGTWDFAFDHKGQYQVPEQVPFRDKIQVPFVYQSELSSVEEKQPCDVVWYRRKLLFSPKAEKRYILNFGAVDYECDLYLNGAYVGNHKGGYTSFSFDVTLQLQDGENEITLRVRDGFGDAEQVRGKQTWTRSRPFGCMYTGYTGIWQSVWLEEISPAHIRHFTILPDVFDKSIHLSLETEDCENTQIEICVSYMDEEICRAAYGLRENRLKTTLNVASERFPWDGLALWSPESPSLYDIRFRVLDLDGAVLDEVAGYFGMRSIESREGKILINNYPVYQKLLLNQGYYPGGWITPDYWERFAEDVQLIKKMGFNGIRIHEKIENPLFLYECDRQGLLVWEEMPSAYRYTEGSRNAITSQWQDIVLRDINHPCIVTWVTSNESWGVGELRRDVKQQSFISAMYYLTKSLDRSRLVIGNDGWEHTCTDVCTIHDYISQGDKLFAHYENKDRVLNSMPSPLFPRYVFADGYQYTGQPVIISEYGGIAMADSDGWGYDQRAADARELVARAGALTDAIKALTYVCGYCYTQFTDIEEEQNGLLHLDRTPKVDLDSIREINERPVKWL